MKSNAILFVVASALSALLLFSYVTLARANENASITQCAGNIKQLAQALRAFAADNGKYPTSLQQLQGIYVKDPELLACAHKSNVERQSVRQLRAGIISLAAGVLALVLRYVFQRRVLTVAMAVVLSVLLFIPGEVRRAQSTAVDYTYAPPAGLGMIPRLQDNPGNHGAYALNALGPDGTVVPVGANVPK